MKLPNPYIGIAPPPGIAVPDPDLLIRDLCSEESPRECFAYPPEAPVFWIKYGHMVYWNEVCAQVMAYEGLRQLGSKVRAPAVFYAQMNYPYTYIIMEYVPGKTAGECLEAAQDDSARELLAQSVSLAISELHRIPIEPGTRPAAISGDKIRHCLLFEDYGSPLHYENVQHMEDHFNAVRVSCVPPVANDLCKDLTTAAIVSRVGRKTGPFQAPRPGTARLLPVRFIPRQLHHQ